MIKTEWIGNRIGTTRKRAVTTSCKRNICYAEVNLKGVKAPGINVIDGIEL